ncbi:MAG: hypothetical protein IPK80_16715 [Nannocystis sp.]|nr:hypothetical protein [Nannocystis sp.]
MTEMDPKQLTEALDRLHAATRQRRRVFLIINLLLLLAVAAILWADQLR